MCRAVSVWSSQCIDVSGMRLVERPIVRRSFLEDVIPALKEGGMTDEQLNTMMVENPKRWLGV